MADVTEVSCWPSCVDALDWSQDGIIALASDERVELLFPNTVSFHRDNESPQWQHVSLKVPLFSTEELPNKDPSALPIYSIGEEISGSTPLAIAWSPPGLAKHRRCVLGTLTSNLVFSLWAAEGKPREDSNWSRKLIVNNVLADYFLDRRGEVQNHLTSDIEEQLRLNARIRAFTWAPAVPGSVTTSIIGTNLSHSPYLIAVANDDNQVAFVEIKSPISSLGQQQTWSAKVLSHFPLAIRNENTPSESTVFEDMMKQQRHVSHIAWSPWICRDNRCCSVIVYATNDDVRARTATYAQNNISFGEEVVYRDVDVRFSGPMTWSPKVENVDHFTLALFGKLGLVFLTISAHDASVIERISHDLDGRWDLTSGVIWDTSQPYTLRLHISSLLSTLHNPTATLEAGSDGFTNLPPPNWRDQIENNLALFTIKNDLKGNGKAKVWGLSASPLGDFVAACSSVHPSDMIEYGPPADRRATVAISTLRQYSQIREAFPRRNVGAEGVLFTLKKLVENCVEDMDQIAGFAQEMVEKLVQSYTFPSQPEGNIDTSTLYSDTDDLKALVETFKKSAFLNPDVIRDRYTILVSHACAVTTSNDLPKTLIAYRLATALQNLPTTLSSTLFSAEILNHHRCLVALIDQVIGPDSTDTPNSGDTSKTDAAVTNEPDIAMKDFNATMTDTCDFCSSPIPFTDLMSATCTQGHQFPRCGLSFLAIQAPGITKYCGICSTPYLSEEFVAAQEVDAQQRSGNEDAAAVENGQKINSEMMESTAQDQIMTGNQENGDKVDNTHNDRGSELQSLGQTQDKAIQIDSTGVESSTQARNNKKLSITLSRVLFLACDVCIYCGAKYVG